MTLTEFLLARITEDEEAAKSVHMGRWTSRVARLDGDLYAHVARQHPARVLAECEAKRQIVAAMMAWDPSPEEPPRVETVEHDAWRVLTYLAAVYADHPDFREEWRA